MRPHILLAFIALFVSACASHEGTNRKAATENQQKEDHYSFMDGQASRFR